MNVKSLTYITLAITFFCTSTTAFLPIVESQDEDSEEEQVPTGQVVNSKYLTLSGVTFNEDDSQVNIAGTISNNSTDQSFASVSIVGQLYDEENQMITSFLVYQPLLILALDSSLHLQLPQIFLLMKKLYDILYCQEDLL